MKIETTESLKIGTTIDNNAVDSSMTYDEWRDFQDK